MTSVHIMLSHKVQSVVRQPNAFELGSLSMTVFNAAYGNKACPCPHGLPELTFCKGSDQVTH